jgi:asparagine synthase (glutamine-hydrolysing)
MCGIAGFISKTERPAAESRAMLDRMCRIITHRGPNEQGMMTAGRAALGMRRLSIIDLKTGQQPIYNEDGNLAVVFNGEIYNFQELKIELEKLGHKFKTHSDTETIVHSYEEYGADCVNHLRGMFAFAIWDQAKQALFIARDRVGKKPLYYFVSNEGDLVFGSELKVLLEHGSLRPEVDTAALDAYMTFGYVPEEFCILKGVKKLLPGHFLTFAEGKVSTKQFWDFDYSETLIKSEDEYVETLREKIKDAVKVRLISEVPLGAFLSGGVDSSTIVGFMSQLLGQPVKTFSIGFEEDSFSELKYARIAAKHFSTEHHEFIVTPDMCDVADELVWHFDEPFADSSALPTYMVSKLAREHVTVALSGDGGDELFAGYTRYVTDRKRSGFAKLPAAVRSGVLQPVSEMLPSGAFGKNYLYNVSLDPIGRYLNSISHYSAMQKKSLYSAALREKLNGTFGAAEHIYRRYAEAVRSGDPVDALLYLDSKTYLPGDILTKVDRMSMAVSLEARVPLLDHELIDFVTKIPADMKLKGLETKHIFKKAARGIVPDAILDRPKQGFGVPINEWINLQLRDRMLGMLNEKRTVERGYFESAYVQNLLSEHQRGRRDHAWALWGLWMLELWHRRYIDK